MLENKRYKHQNKDIIGRRFGKLIPVALSEKKDKKRKSKRFFHCRCDCGNFVECELSGLIEGNSLSCGCVTPESYNLVNKRFGKLIVIERSDKRLNTNNNIFWRCRCDCGGERIVSGNLLRKGKVTHCKCGNRDDLTGKTFGFLTVISFAGYSKTKTKRPLWNCLCLCGKNKIVYADSLRRKDKPVLSCGCLWSGANHPYYNQNISKKERENYKNRCMFSDNDKWRRKVLQTFNYTCVICGKYGKGNVVAHHKNSWGSFPEQRFNINNGVCLCNSKKKIKYKGCHQKFHAIYSPNTTKENFEEFFLNETGQDFENFVKQRDLLNEKETMLEQV